MKFAWIEAKKASFPVSAMCRVLKVSRSGFYRWLTAKSSSREKEDRALAARIVRIHDDSRRTYGSPRVHQELRAQGTRVGRKRVERLMRETGIKARQRRRYKATTDSKHGRPVAPNRLARQFAVKAKNCVWVTDVKAIPTIREGWVYLAPVLDLFARRVIGWDTSTSNDTDLAVSSLSKAIRARGAPEGILHHSDRGSPYASDRYVKLLEAHGMERSMSRKGDCWDNAVAESFFSTVEWEALAGTLMRDEAHVREVIESFIDFYNHRRRHSTLDYMSPVEFEIRCNTGSDLAA